VEINQPLSNRYRRESRAAEPARLRICVLIPTHWEAVMGGAQYQAKLLVEHMLASGGYEVYYLARKVRSDYRPDGYEVRQIGTSSGSRLVLDSVRLLSALREIRPHTIYHQVGCAYTGVAAWYCRHNDCRLVWHIASDMDLLPWSGRWLERASFGYIDKRLLEYGIRHADRIVAQTEVQAKRLNQVYGRTPDRIVRNFHPAPRELIDKQSRPIEIVWLANLKRVKQPELFVQLARRLEPLGARFVMIGDLQASEGWQRSVLAAIAAAGNIDYVGKLSQDQVNARLARAHVLVNTSVYEGFSNTFIQAWMREVPVVSLNVNPDGVFDDGRLGLCADGDVDRLVDQVAQFIRDDEFRERIGKAARQDALERYRLQNMDELLELL
jgi:glycosyltransferase involved in cell wall biosynthesis